MRREPSLTFGGALEILGHHDHPTIDKLDKILGGVILAGRLGTGIAAMAGLPLAPVGLWAAIWGWTEQKDAAFGLLRKALDSATGKLNGTAGYERRQLIAAAHTTIVGAAFFEALREEIGQDTYDKLKITDAQKTKLLTEGLRREGVRLLDGLYEAEVPAPSPSRGFEENIGSLEEWMFLSGARFQVFLMSLPNALRLEPRWDQVERSAVERYRSHFLELAAKVPEFAIWALLDEQAATRALVREQNAELAAAIDQNTAAMARVESLLALTARTTGAPPIVSDLRAIVDRANKKTLTESIVPADGSRYGPRLVFPPVSSMYINPRFRITETGPDNRVAQVADLHWWDGLPARADFDLVLSAHVSTPHATRLPMLLLGDPGAGKSLLTRVLAARLGSAGYTVVHVPLRKVGANAPIGHQIQQALDESTAGRVPWGGLSDQSVGTTRVVLLDGLDELLQASSSDRSGYLQEVVDFQDAEAAQERPLVVIVTSRIVVADRVDIPQGTVVVKLETFTDEDIEDWLGRWRHGNSVAIATGKVRALTLEAALSRRDLARQPLLLLMLSIYAADPALPPLDADMSTADLYRSLLEEFGLREARKTRGDYAHGREVEERVREHLDRLAIAALAMFNRGRQDISEDELGADLKALDERLMGRTRPDEAGQRVIGEFFFVHAPEAQVRSAGGQPRRGYEFLHATFGEYLTASRVMAELAEMAAKAYAGRRGPSAPEDDLVFVLLSHQPLAARRSTLTFAEQIANALPAAERQRLLGTLEMLLETYRDRHGSDQYANYRPTPTDTIRQLACYSANLVSLRLTLEPSRDPVPLATLLRVAEGDGLPQWRSMVMLWQSGLDASGMQAILSMLLFSSSPAAVVSVGLVRLLGDSAAVARLVDDHDLEWQIQYGTAIWDADLGAVDYFRHDDWVHCVSAMLIPLAAGMDVKLQGALPYPAEGEAAENIGRVAALIFNYLRVFRDDAYVLEVTRYLFGLPKIFAFDGYALARAVILRPGLLEDVPELRDAGLYGDYYPLIAALGNTEVNRKIGHRRSGPRKFDAEEMRELLGHVVYESAQRWDTARGDS